MAREERVKGEVIDLPPNIKACPACGMLMEKLDGDDNMMCGCEAKAAGGNYEKALAGGGCGHEFVWSTLKPVASGRMGAPANDRQVKFVTKPPDEAEQRAAAATLGLVVEPCGVCHGRGPCKVCAGSRMLFVDALRHLDIAGQPQIGRDVTEVKTFACSKCPAVFSREQKLRQHEDLVHGAGAADSYYPRYWVHAGELPSSPCDAFDQMFLVERSMLQGFYDLVKSTYVEKSTKDRPCPRRPPCGKRMDGGCECVNVKCKGVSQHPGMPLGYRVAKVIRVEDSKMWACYNSLRNQITEKRRGQDIHTTVLTNQEVQRFPGLFQPLRQSSNEVYLFHGTLLRSSLNICQNDIRIELSGSKTGAAFGPGFYMSESFTKADEYAHDEPDAYYDGVFAVIVFRVCLGKTFVTTEFDYPIENRRAYDHVESGECDSVIGDRAKATGTFREFIIYNKDQAYPEYVILYERVYKDPEFGHPRLGPDFSLQIPVYWCNCHIDPAQTTFKQSYPVRKRTAAILQSLLQNTLPKGDTSKLSLESAVRIENSNMWMAHVTKKAELAAKWGLSCGERCVPPHRLDRTESPETSRVLTTACMLEGDLEAAISIQNLTVPLNELLLWHGTSKTAAQAITERGFNINREGSCPRFGHGAYFADEVSKSLSYAEESDGKRYLLLCRVVCGQMHYTEQSHDQTASDTSRRLGKDSLLVNPDKKGPREFIAFEESQVYPEYVLEVTWQQ